MASPSGGAHTWLGGGGRAPPGRLPGRLGRLPWLDPLDRQSLAAAFADGFHVADFAP